MQTFLAYSDFERSARCLDNKRLGNQCYREVKTLLNGGWENHPASKMWRGYEYALCKYGIALALEMAHRNKEASVLSEKLPWKPHIPIKWWRYYALKMVQFKDTGMPPWLGNSEFHSSHKANLIRKDPKWYGKFGWIEQPAEGYIWPT